MQNVMIRKQNFFFLKTENNECLRKREYSTFYFSSGSQNQEWYKDRRYNFLYKKNELPTPIFFLFLLKGKFGWLRKRINAKSL